MHVATVAEKPLGRGRVQDIAPEKAAPKSDYVLMHADIWFFLRFFLALTKMSFLRVMTVEKVIKFPPGNNIAWSFGWCLEDGGVLILGRQEDLFIFIERA
jgi:hypothetical protein